MDLIQWVIFVSESTDSLEWITFSSVMNEWKKQLDELIHWKESILSSLQIESNQFIIMIIISSIYMRERISSLE